VLLDKEKRIISLKKAIRDSGGEIEINANELELIYNKKEKSKSSSNCSRLPFLKCPVQRIAARAASARNPERVAPCSLA
jgi:hypothetical protein